MEDNKLMKTNDVLEIFKNKYKNNIFRTIGNTIQHSKTIEIQNVQLESDKPCIVREPSK